MFPGYITVFYCNYYITVFVRTILICFSLLEIVFGRSHLKYALSDSLLPFLTEFKFHFLFICLFSQHLNPPESSFEIFSLLFIALFLVFQILASKHLLIGKKWRKFGIRFSAAPPAFFFNPVPLTPGWHE